MFFWWTDIFFCLFFCFKIFSILKKETFLVPAKGTHQVAYGYCNLFAGIVLIQSDGDIRSKLLTFRFCMFLQPLSLNTVLSNINS